MDTLPLPPVVASTKKRPWRKAVVVDWAMIKVSADRKVVEAEAPAVLMTVSNRVLAAKVLELAPLATVSELEAKRLWKARPMAPMSKALFEPATRLPPMMMVDEADSGPETVSGPAILEVTELMKPPMREDRPVARKVEEAFSGPLTVSGALTVLEAELMNPPVKVARLLTRKVEEAFSGPATDRGPLTVLEAKAMKPAR